MHGARNENSRGGHSFRKMKDNRVGRKHAVVFGVTKELLMFHRSNVVFAGTVLSHLVDLKSRILG